MGAAFSRRIYTLVCFINTIKALQCELGSYSFSQANELWTWNRISAFGMNCSSSDQMQLILVFVNNYQEIFRPYHFISGQIIILLEKSQRNILITGDARLYYTERTL